jgi:hypothetical protein
VLRKQIERHRIVLADGALAIHQDGRLAATMSDTEFVQDVRPQMVKHGNRIFAVLQAIVDLLPDVAGIRQAIEPDRLIAGGTYCRRADEVIAHRNPPELSGSLAASRLASGAQ